MRIKSVDATPGERSVDGFAGLSFRFGRNSGPPTPSVVGEHALAIIAGIEVFSTDTTINGGAGELALVDNQLVGFLSSGRGNSGPFDEFDTNEAVVFATSLVEISAIGVTHRSGLFSAKRGRNIAIEVGDPEDGGAIVTVVPIFAFTSSGLDKAKDATPIANQLAAAVSESRGVQASWQQIPEGLAVEF